MGSAARHRGRVARWAGQGRDIVPVQQLGALAWPQHERPHLQAGRESGWHSAGGLGLARSWWSLCSSLGHGPADSIRRLICTKAERKVIAGMGPLITPQVTAQICKQTQGMWLCKQTDTACRAIQVSALDFTATAAPDYPAPRRACIPVGKLPEWHIPAISGSSKVQQATGLPA